MAADMELALRVLAAMGVAEVGLSLNGGGDSGDCEIDTVRYADGRVAHELPRIAIGFDNGGVLDLPDVVIHAASEAPDGDWVNNEGGQGTVTLLPLAPCNDERVQCEMDYRVEGGDDGFDEDDAGEPDYAEAGAAALDAGSDAVLPLIGFADSTRQPGAGA